MYPASLFFRAVIGLIESDPTTVVVMFALAVTGCMLLYWFVVSFFRLLASRTTENEFDHSGHRKQAVFFSGLGIVACNFPFPATFQLGVGDLTIWTVIFTSGMGLFFCGRSKNVLG